MSSARVKESSLFTMYLLSLPLPLPLPLPVGHIVLVNVSILEPSGILRVGEEPFVVLRKLISSFVDVKHCSEKDGPISRTRSRSSTATQILAWARTGKSLQARILTKAHKYLLQLNSAKTCGKISNTKVHKCMSLKKGQKKLDGKRAKNKQTHNCVS